MVIYEVNLEIQKSVRAEYLVWLPGHMRELLQLPGFENAVCFEVSSPASGADVFQLVVQYTLDCDESLESYFLTYAEDIRKKGMDRFPGKFKASRRVMKPLFVG